MKKNIILLFICIFISVILLSFELKGENNLTDTENIIRIALSIDKEDANKLENEINLLLSKTKSQKRIIIICLSKGNNGYDQKYALLRNNRVDVMEAGFLIFYEFYKRRSNAKVMLHACYFVSHDEKMFLIRGNIITNKGDKLKLSNIKNRIIYAVSESSSSGYMLQKAFLGEKGISLGKNIKFLGDQRLILQEVLKHPKSIGFVGNFIPLDKNKFSPLAHSPKAPGGVLFADSDVFDSPETYLIIKRHIELFYLKLYCRHKANHFFVAPLCADYKKYFPNYKGAEDLEQLMIKKRKFFFERTTFI
jgi:hypothetical protein